MTRDNATYGPTLCPPCICSLGRVGGRYWLSAERLPFCVSILLFSDIAAEETRGERSLMSVSETAGRERADLTSPPYLHTSPSLVDLDVLDREKKELFRSFLPPRFVFRDRLNNGP